MSNDQITKPQASDEIDLIELFNKIGNSIKKGVMWIINRLHDFFLLLIRKSLWIISFSIIGAIVGYVFFMATPRYYSSEMVAISNALNNTYVVSSINLLDDLFKGGNQSIAANYLDINKDEALQIKSIGAYYGIDVNKDGLADYVDYKEEFNPRDTSIRRLSNFFYIKLEVYSESIFGKARDGLRKYINKNNFVIENNQVRIAQSEELIKSIDLEIKKLDSLQKIQYFEIPKSQKASNTQMVVLNEKEMKLYHDQILALRKQKLLLEKDITINKEPITVVQDFTPLSKAENPVTKYLINWVALFSLLGFIVSLVWQFRMAIIRLIRDQKY
ncbi:MAG: hypothetical protein F9K37_11915 [Bacteroidales bacterium]|nr:MAG: hypothetical protein F9K37_11915 [Bacteroidales bacterium]